MGDWCHQGEAAITERDGMTTTTILRKAGKLAALPAGLASSRDEADFVILLYHKIGTGSREIDLPLSLFRAQLRRLKSKLAVRPLDDVLAGPTLGGVVLSVDDGYRDFHDNVVPLLVELNMPAILYLATGLTRNCGLDTPGVGWGELNDAVSTGLVTVGSHTHTHADLSGATERQADEEMRRSKEIIEDRLGIACRHFAYPWSVGSVAAERVARQLFDSAAIAWGTNRWRSFDAHRLARVPVLRSDGLRFFDAKAKGWLDHEATLYRLIRRGPWRRR
jgi:peptidoglycan/xylan/chitin deacetylase (PgdA/CDA1 family)